MKAVQKRSEFFSTVDAAWLHMEKPTNMAMITGVMIFDEPLEFPRLKPPLRVDYWFTIVFANGL